MPRLAGQQALLQALHWWPAAGPSWGGRCSCEMLIGDGITVVLWAAVDFFMIASAFGGLSTEIDLRKGSPRSALRSGSWWAAMDSNHFASRLTGATPGNQYARRAS